MYTHPLDLLTQHYERAEEQRRRAHLVRLARSGQPSSRRGGQPRLTSSRAWRTIRAAMESALRRPLTDRAGGATDRSPLAVPSGADPSMGLRAGDWPAHLASLGESVATDGIAPHWPNVASLLLDAAWHGVDGILIDVVADPKSPAIARERALGKILAVLSSGPTAPLNEPPFDLEQRAAIRAASGPTGFSLAGTGARSEAHSRSGSATPHPPTELRLRAVSNS